MSGLVSKKYTITIEFTTELLGTKSSDPAVHARWVAAKHPVAPQEDEECLDVHVEGERGCTMFHRTSDGDPALHDYQIKGFFKAAADAIRSGGLDKDLPESKKAKTKKWGSAKGKIDKFLHVSPRILPVDGSVAGILRRPLRVASPRGLRVMLVGSEYVKEGTTVSFQVDVLGTLITEEMLRTMLDFGKFSGIGQWRNAGYGHFNYTMEEVV